MGSTRSTLFKPVFHVSLPKKIKNRRIHLLARFRHIIRLLINVLKFIHGAQKKGQKRRVTVVAQEPDLVIKPVQRIPESIVITDGQKTGIKLQDVAIEIRNMIQTIFGGPGSFKDQTEQIKSVNHDAIHIRCTN